MRMLRGLLGNTTEISSRVEAGLFKQVLPNEPNFPPDSNKTKALLAAKRTDKTNRQDPIESRPEPATQENTR
jgi:hypothetical protein